MRELLTAVFKITGASGIGLVLSMVNTKIMAFVLGPSGLGLVSLVRQTYLIGVVLGGVNAQTAMAQGIAARSHGEQIQYLSAVRQILAVTTSIVSLTFLLFPAPISMLIMGRADESSVELIRWLSVPIVAGVALVYLLGILTGFRAVGHIAVVQITGAFAGIAFAYPVASLLRAGYSPALVFYLLAPVLAMAVLALMFVAREGWVSVAFRGIGHTAGTKEASAFLRLAGTLLLSGLVAALIPLAIRMLSLRRFGLHGVGLFDVAWSISVSYIALAMASFSSYYVPSLSRLHSISDRRTLVNHVLRLSILLMVPLVVTITAIRPAVVRLLYSSEFLPAVEIMRWMLIGDYLKVTSWVFSHTMLAFADTKTLAWTEILWGALSVGGAALAVLGFHSLQGIGINYVFIYGLYLLFSLGYARRRGYFVPDRWLTILWLKGLMLILAVAVHTWNDLSIRPIPTLVYVSASIYVSLGALRQGEKGGLRALFYRRPWRPVVPNVATEADVIESNRRT